MNYAPVALFIYNRFDHFEQTFKALSNCPEAAKTKLYIFSDGPKKAENIEQIKAVRQKAKELIANAPFEEVNLIESEQNKGLAKSIISGVTEVINKHSRIIVLEDDCVPSEYFLKFMNSCLDYYKSDNSVGSIAGFTPPMKFPSKYTDDIFATYRSCSWGWATWKDRWYDVDWEMNNFQEFIRNKDNIKRMNMNGSDRFIRLYRQRGSNSTSWSVRFGAHLIMNKLITIYPRYSYISNIGCDNSGVHSSVDDGKNLQVDLNLAIKSPTLKHIEIDNRIQKEFKRHFSAGFASDVKRYVAMKAILMKESK